MMKVVRVLAVVLMFCLSLAAVAQQPPKAEVSVDYSLVVTNPARSYANKQYLNGGGGAFLYNLGKYFGLKGEIQGYTSSTATFTIPAGRVIPEGVYKAKGDMFTYLFGPQFNIPMKKTTMFGELLFGDAYNNNYADLYKAAGYSSGAAQHNAFAMALGVGLDYKYKKSISIRVAELDYLLTRYSIVVLGTSNQNSFRYLGGIVFSFGGK